MGLITLTVSGWCTDTTLLDYDRGGNDICSGLRSKNYCGSPNSKLINSPITREEKINNMKIEFHQRCRTRFIRWHYFKSLKMIDITFFKLVIRIKY